MSRHRLVDRTDSTNDHTAGYGNPNRDSSLGFSEYKYQEVIAAAWAKILAKPRRKER